MMFANRKTVIGTLAIVLCSILGACTGMNAAPTTTEMATPSSALTPVITTPVPSATPSVTPTLPPTPTYTASPHPVTPTPTPTPSRTFPPNPQATLTEQYYESRATQLAGFPHSCSPVTYVSFSFSPGGNWLAISCDQLNDPQMEVDGAGGKRWTLRLKDFVSEEYFTKDGKFQSTGGLDPRFWTNNEKYLYFDSDISVDGGSSCTFFFGFGDLFRLDLSDGTVSTVLDTNHAYFSPDGRWLAYLNYSNRIAILNLDSGEVIHSYVDSDPIGDFTWSPDSSELAFASCRLTADYTAIEKSSVKIYSLNSDTVRTVLEVTGNHLGIRSPEENQFQIENFDPQTRESVYLPYNWSSGQLATLTPTPTP